MDTPERNILRRRGGGEKWNGEVLGREIYATISFISYFGTGLCIQLSAKRLPPPPQLGAFSGRNLYGENICKGINVAVRACVVRGSLCSSTMSGEDAETLNGRKLESLTASPLIA